MKSKLFCEMSPIEKIKDYHKNDIWGFLIEFFEKLNKMDKKNDK